MLIVNADDLGRCRDDTDSALACHARGRITSTSAMVFMEDSGRAAALARDAGIPIGLHLNLSEAFSAPDVPAGLRRQHDRICRFLRSSRFALLLYHPLLAKDFEAVVAAQLDEFTRLYGRAPAHVDGHQHMHLCSNVLLQRLLPAGTRVRRSFTFAPGEKGAVNRWYRASVDRALRRRHPITDRFYSLTLLLRNAGIERLGEIATREDVELMVHPTWPHEREYLMGEACAALLAEAAPTATNRRLEPTTT